MARVHKLANTSGTDLETAWLEPRWYVLFVRSNQEKRVAQHLSSRSIEHFLPTYPLISQWRDRKVKLLKPLFPGYVFIKLFLADRLKALLVPNVVNLVGTKNSLSVISDEEIEWVRRGVEHGGAKPHACLNAGEVVIIKTGTLAGMEGILLRVQNSTRVLVQLNSISRAFTVEVDSNWVEPTRPELRRTSSSLSDCA